MSSGPIVDLKASLDYFLGLFVDWLLAALHPIRNCQSLLSVEDEGERARKTFGLLGTSFAVTIILNLPLYQPYGIGLGSVGFHISSLTCLTFTMIACGLAIQLSLRIYGIKSTLSDTTSIYTACVLCYQPLVAVLSYPSYLRLFSVLSSAKRQGLDLGQTVNLFLAHSATADRSYGFIGISSSLCSCILLALTCICSTLMATVVADRSSASRLKSFSAFAFASMILLPPILVTQGFLGAYVAFNFIELVGSSGAAH